MADIFDVCKHCKNKNIDSEVEPCEDCYFSHESGYTEFVWDERDSE